VPTTHDAIVIGAGPAGLASSHELTQSGVDHLVLERGGEVAHTWANLYDSLVLHTGRHLSTLPGLPFPAGTPIFPPRRAFLDYLQRYAETFRLPIVTNAEATGVERRDGWIVRTRAGDVHHCRSLVVATGIVANPHVPEIPGRERFGGEVIHSVSYRRPDKMKGRRVLVVGAGNSAGEISVELLRAGAEVTLAVRSGAPIVPRELMGLPTQYVAVLLSPLPKAVVRRVTAVIGRLRGPRVLPLPPLRECQVVPLIGLALADALRARTIALRPGLTQFTSSGVQFGDGREEPFDLVILATGYRAALGCLGDLIRVDSCGFASRRDRIVSADQPDLYFVGHNYDIRGGLLNIARDARRVGREVTRALRDTARTSIETPPPRSGR
jgi:cation diffusion facilitator CzcD-associated flavoprotein CzcO